MSLTELNLNDLVLTWVITYGSPMVAAVLLLGALGLPMPGTLLVIAAGAFVRQGVLDLYTTPSLALLGALAGDTVVYGAGRFARGWIQRRFGQSAAWQKSEAYFKKRGGIAIYLTRWLITPLAIPTNLIAGSSGYPFWKFLLFDLSGELTWIVLYGGLGYAFGSQWELISDFISDFSGLILGVVALGAGVYMLFRWQKRPSAERAPVTAAAAIAETPDV
ncbi:MAG: DedA family protein [Chloroflexi bacterium]|nr:MAG: DedA family protein [Chloroflexota bacterium]